MKGRNNGVTRSPALPDINLSNTAWYTNSLLIFAPIIVACHFNVIHDGKCVGPIRIRQQTPT